MKSHENRLLAWVAWCAAQGVTLASQITPALVDAWMNERSKTASRRTINRDLLKARAQVDEVASVYIGNAKASQLIYGGGTWLEIGEGTTSKVRTSTDDMATWIERDTGADRRGIPRWWVSRGSHRRHVRASGWPVCVLKQGAAFE